jgi:hypothetical protein
MTGLLTTRQVSLERLALLPPLRLVRVRRTREHDHIPHIRHLSRHMLLLPMRTLVVVTIVGLADFTLCTTRLGDLVCAIVNLHGNSTTPTKHSEHVIPLFCKGHTTHDLEQAHTCH